MPTLNATPASTTANTYATIAEAQAVIDQRLYTTDWEGAAGPTADGYAINNGGGYSSGAESATIDSGTGTLALGDQFTFAGHATVYEVITTAIATGSTTIAFTPALTASVADDEVIQRQTLNDQEKSLTYATRLLDRMMKWFGSPATSYSQSLRWPRLGVINADGEEFPSNIIPAQLIEGVTELALSLLGGDTFKQPELLGQGFSRAKVGEIEIWTDSKSESEAIPSNVLSLLDELGVLEAAAKKGSAVVSVVRS